MAKKRAKKYEEKFELDKKVEFDDLFKVAINHDPKKVVKVKPKKAKKR